MRKNDRGKKVIIQNCKLNFNYDLIRVCFES